MWSCSIIIVGKESFLSSERIGTWIGSEGVSRWFSLLLLIIHVSFLLSHLLIILVWSVLYRFSLLHTIGLIFFTWWFSQLHLFECCHKYYFIWDKVEMDWFKEQNIYMLGKPSKKKQDISWHCAKFIWHLPTCRGWLCSLRGLIIVGEHNSPFPFQPSP